MRRRIDRRTFLEIGGAATGVAVGGGVAAHLAADEDALLMGVWNYVLPIPGPIWRSQTGGERGLYLTLDQSVFVTPTTQGPLFGFPPHGGREAHEG